MNNSKVPQRQALALKISFPQGDDTRAIQKRVSSSAKKTTSHVLHANNDHFHWYFIPFDDCADHLRPSQPIPTGQAPRQILLHYHHHHHHARPPSYEFRGQLRSGAHGCQRHSKVSWSSRFDSPNSRCTTKILARSKVGNHSSNTRLELPSPPLPSCRSTGRSCHHHPCGSSRPDPEALACLAE